MLVVIRGAGDIASGIALRLRRAGMDVVMCDLAVPTSIRRTVCFSEAIRLGAVSVEGVRGKLCASPQEARAVAAAGDIAVLVDPDAACVEQLAPDALVDAILAKKNLGTRRDMAPVVVGVGPGFTAQQDCDAAVETMRGHYLGRVYYEGSPLPNTAVPGLIGGYAGERVMRAPADGIFEPCVEIGDTVEAGAVCATVAGEPMRATIAGTVRGLLQAGVPVRAGMKSGDVDPRCDPAYIRTASDKASAVGGGVLEAILSLSGALVTGREGRGEAGREDRGMSARPGERGCREDRSVPAQSADQSRRPGSSLSDVALVSALIEELSAGRRVGLASLLATRGSMPRHEGARLVVTEDGRLLGTVGGGAVEQIAIERAEAVRDGAAPCLEWVTSSTSDMACGGDALLAVRVLASGDLPVLCKIRETLEGGGETVVEEGWSDPAAPTMALVEARKARPGWDEEGSTYRERVFAPCALHVFGAGHVGAALVGMAAAAGFEPRVYDDRPELATPERLPEAASVTCGNFHELAVAAQIGPRDFVVVLTHGHRADGEVLRSVLARDPQPAYVGCIGSRNKAALTRRSLVEAGVDPERVDAVHLPIGEDIGAVTPQEIAVSITAQLIRVRADLRDP